MFDFDLFIAPYLNIERLSRLTHNKTNVNSSLILVCLLFLFGLFFGIFRLTCIAALPFITSLKQKCQIHMIGNYRNVHVIRINQSKVRFYWFRKNRQIPVFHLFFPLHKKWSFPRRISSVNAWRYNTLYFRDILVQYYISVENETKYAGSCGLGNIFRRNP